MRMRASLFVYSAIAVKAISESPPPASSLESHLANLPGEVVDALQRVLAENNNLKSQNQEREAMLADYRSAYANEQRPYVEKLSKIATEYNKGVEDPIIGSTLK